MESLSNCLLAYLNYSSAKSPEFFFLGVVNVTVRAEAVASQTLCNNEIVSVPDRGRIDVVTQSLIVKAEGTEMTNTYNWLLCPKGEALTEEVDLLLPENVIVGSARASVSVLGKPRDRFDFSCSFGLVCWYFAFCSMEWR